MDAVQSVDHLFKYSITTALNSEPFNPLKKTHHLHCWSYNYSNTKMNWDEARTFCKKNYTDMVAIQNHGEINHLNSILPRVSGYYWIGIRKINNSWTWVGTNKKLTAEAENWAEHEPNNGRNNEDCVEIYIKREKDEGKWNDESCKKKKTALCYTVVKCQAEDIFNPENGSVHCVHPNGGFSYNSQCEYTCNEGYQAVGSQTTRCESLATWSTKPPTCEPVQCSEISKPLHATMQCNHPLGIFSYQSTCEFSCQEGYTLTSSSSSKLIGPTFILFLKYLAGRSKKVNGPQMSRGPKGLPAARPAPASLPGLL
uniref:Selectin E n=1 Tax=Astyanax mexicanus TaxID=7994 RepID=A0A8B9HVR8_ASTMX